MRDLMRDKDLVIKPADKGSSIVIINTIYYREKVVPSDHLNGNEYTQVDLNNDKKVVKELANVVKKHSKCLTEKEKKYLTDFDWKTSEFYVLPKVHKCQSILDTIGKGFADDVITILEPPDLKGRPIVVGCTTPTRHLSEFIEKLLKPLVEAQKSYIKND